MTYVLTIKAIDSSEREIDMETSNKEEAIHISKQYTRGGEGIIEYAHLTDGYTILELISFYDAYFQEEDM